jgi:hypothetical protein
VVYFRVIIQYSSGRTEEDRKIPQSEWLLTRPGLEPCILRIKVYNVTATPTCSFRTGMGIGQEMKKYELGRKRRIKLLRK